MEAAFSTPVDPCKECLDLLTCTYWWMVASLTLGTNLIPYLSWISIYSYLRHCFLFTDPREFHQLWISLPFCLSISEHQSLWHWAFPLLLCILTPKVNPFPCVLDSTLHLSGTLFHWAISLFFPISSKNPSLWPMWVLPITQCTNHFHLNSCFHLSL